jgi:hypothetical protein
MTPNDIRTELMAQHSELRTHIQTTRAAAERVGRGERAQRELRRELTALVDLMRRHNRREEELLGGIIPTIDAWGPERAQLMNDEHIAEHREMYAALMDLGATSDPAKRLALVNDELNRLIAHIGREEKGVLAALREDLATTEYFGG